jgi:hypothetical protein
LSQSEAWLGRIADSQPGRYNSPMRGNIQRLLLIATLDLSQLGEVLA